MTKDPINEEWRKSAVCSAPICKTDSISANSLQSGVQTAARLTQAQGE